MFCVFSGNGYNGAAKMERHPSNPILTRKDIPAIPPDLVDVSSVFNPGAVMFGTEYLLLLRVQNRGRRTYFMTARSGDGVKFIVEERIVDLRGLESLPETVYHCYDPRITCLDGMYYILFAMDMNGCCRLGLARTEDFNRFDFLGVVSDGDSRNGVLFPEKIGGHFLRLERPNTVKVAEGPLTGETVVLSESDNLLRWRTIGPVFSGRFHYWDELVGPGPPPVKTREGWLCLYHGVATHLVSSFIYQAGVVLLDLNNPQKVTGRCPYNILEPRELYELTGQVPNVVFPSGMIVDGSDEEGFALPESRIFLYYGAADTCVCLATTTVGALLDKAKIGI
jgi:beta-1,4-mannooligosaccharide/beta-1,4-mannosyl-N-acetylglucosamine phosphorylase